MISGEGQPTNRLSLTRFRDQFGDDDGDHSSRSLGEHVLELCDELNERRRV
jgi:hypothetical protein